MNKDKHSIFLATFVNYGRKKFYNIDFWSEFSSPPAPASTGADAINRSSLPTSKSAGGFAAAKLF